MSNLAYTEGKLALANGGVDLGNDTLKMMLLTSDYTPAASHSLATIQASEITNTDAPTYSASTCVGYTTNGATLGNQAVATDGANVKLSSDNVVWSDATITAKYGVLYDSTASVLLRLVDFGGNVASLTAPFTIACPTTGWIREE